MFTSVVRRNNDIRSDKVCAKKKKGQKGKKSSGNYAKNENKITN